jgi:hypothetical protein
VARESWEIAIGGDGGFSVGTSGCGMGGLEDNLIGAGKGHGSSIETGERYKAAQVEAREFQGVALDFFF